MADLLEGPAPTGAPAFLGSAFRDLAPQQNFQEKDARRVLLPPARVGITWGRRMRRRSKGEHGRSAVPRRPCAVAMGDRRRSARRYLRALLSQAEAQTPRNPQHLPLEKKHRGPAG